MSFSLREALSTTTKHKVFLSFYHKDDEAYRDEFEKLFGKLFINKSVADGDIDSDLSTDYIKRLIQEGYITDASVVVVLIGPHTYCRKHVDWEISAGLNVKVGSNAGLMGLLLPTHSNYNTGNYTPGLLPPRLADNAASEYAKIYNWTTAQASIKAWIDDAFDARISRRDKIKNSRAQFQRNQCS
jgi:hypothetical protein